MDLAQMLDTLSQKLPGIIQEHWMKVAGSVMLLVASTIFYKIVARYKFNQHRTDDVLTVSVNNITELSEKEKINGKTHKLSIRTIGDDPIQNVVTLSARARELLQQAIARTTVENPLIMLGKNQSPIMKDIINSISSKFPEGIIAWDNELQMHEVKYIAILTCERFPKSDPDWDEMWEKPRVLLIKKEVLEKRDLFDGNQKFKPEFEHHIWRIRALRIAQADYFDHQDACMEFSIYIRV